MNAIVTDKSKARKRGKHRPVTTEGARRKRIHRLVRAHLRLIAAIIVGLLTFALLLVTDLKFSTRLLLSWDTTALAYVTMAARNFIHFDIDQVQRRASEQDEGGIAILLLTVAAASASLVAIVLELGSITEDDPSRPWHFALAASTIALSWLFIHTVFAFHYAYEYYGDRRDGVTGGLSFPEDDAPDYWDFMYFSLVLGMTFQVSDVQICSKPIRRLAAVHALVSFIYNVAIGALMVNIVANLLRCTSKTRHT